MSELDYHDEVFLRPKTYNRCNKCQQDNGETSIQNPHNTTMRGTGASNQRYDQLTGIQRHSYSSTHALT